ncbi:unnamed protein product [Urochloa humidicola]
MCEQESTRGGSIRPISCGGDLHGLRRLLPPMRRLPAEAEAGDLGAAGGSWSSRRCISFAAPIFPRPISKARGMAGAGEREGKERREVDVLPCGAIAAAAGALACKAAAPVLPCRTAIITAA